MTREDFKKLVDEDGFIEHAQFGSNLYGTSVQAVKNVAEKGQNCILDIEMEVRYVGCGTIQRCLINISDDIVGCQAGQKEGPQRPLRLPPATFRGDLGAATPRPWHR